MIIAPNNLATSMKKNTFSVFVTILLAFLLILDASAQNVFSNNSPFNNIDSSIKMPTKQPQALPKKGSKLEEIIPRMNYPTDFLQPLPLKGVKIPGLTKSSVQLLGQNFFVVVNNTRYKTMAELYRDNRLNRKSNYVTADSIIHPYFSFTNRVIADVIQEHIVSNLNAMLKAMLTTSLVDYKQAEDAEVKSDIEHNIAFLVVAINLIDPKCLPTVPLSIMPMIQNDLRAIHTGKGKVSAIFNCQEDFSSYQPIGWYNANVSLQNFYRCQRWLTHMAYPFADISVGIDRTASNSFRRSVLLYRSLDLASVAGKPAYEIWERLYKTWFLFGTMTADWQENTISPLEYKAQVKTAGDNLKVTLNALAEPFFRTKLLLAIRKQKPLKLGTTSIFDLSEGSAANKDNAICFHLLPAVGDPEWPWLRDCLILANREENNMSGVSDWPFALLILQARGAAQANNTLLDTFSRLDPGLLQALPVLDRLVSVKLPGGITKARDDRSWQIISGYFKPMPTTQQVLHTDTWMTRMLESAFACWIDSCLTIAPENLNGPTPAQPSEETLPSKVNAKTKKTKMAVFHYVQPSPEIFHQIAADAKHMQTSLNELGYLSNKFNQRFSDFIRLSNRLEKMATLEVKGQTLPVTDVKLLQNIDLVLEQVEQPLPGILPIPAPPINASSNLKVGANDDGVTFALGSPGQLFIILQDGSNWTLARGGVYTYYEIPYVIKPKYWQNTLENDLLKLPYWTEKFDTIQFANKTK